MTEEHQASVELEEMSVVSDSPGAILSNARKYSGLTIEEVATRLCLRSSVIEAIEVDNYSTISRHVFSRGYLRAYARLMHLEPDMIIEKFNALNLKDEPKERMLWQAPRIVIPRKESPVKWLLILLVFCSCVLGIMWFTANNTKHTLLPKASLSLLNPIEHKTLKTDIEQDSLGAYSPKEGKKL